MFVVQKPNLSVFGLFEVFLNNKRAFGLVGQPQNRPTKNSGRKSLNVDFYRFWYRFLMARTFLAFSVNFWLVERLGQQGSPNNRLTKNSGRYSLNVDFYRFQNRFSMASTFLAISADFWLVERLGQQGSPNNRTTKNSDC